MPGALIEKIINELALSDYSNRLSFYNNNEPFLDERIYDIVRLAREKLPRAYLELKSNGITLGIEDILKIFNSGLDMLYINYHPANEKMKQNILNIRSELRKIRRFKGHLEQDRYFSRIKIYIRDINKISGSRAGNSPNKKLMLKPLDRVCLRPCEMITINPEGFISVCSEDFLHELNMGNINESGVIDIWRSDKWNLLRKSLLQGDRRARPVCAKCDYAGYTHEMLLENDLLGDVLFSKLMARAKNAMKLIVRKKTELF